MPKVLPPVREILKSAWSQAKEHAGPNLQISLGYIVLALISFLIAFISYKTPLGFSPLIRLLDLIIIQGLCTMWVSMRLTHFILSQDTYTKPTLAPTFRTYLSYLFIAICSGLAVLGGALIFLLPGIWMSLLFVFAPIFLFTQGIRGTKALSASADLVKGRWFATLWRFAIPFILIIAISFFLSSILSGIMHAIVGYNPATFVKENGLNYWWISLSKQGYLALTADRAIQVIVLAVIAPFSKTIAIVLFKELKKTR
jgi:hypothetical protein